MKLADLKFLCAKTSFKMCFSHNFQLKIVLTDEEKLINPSEKQA
jgi:hypothetical protein